MIQAESVMEYSVHSKFFPFYSMFKKAQNKMLKGKYITFRNSYNSFINGLFGGCF